MEAALEEMLLGKKITTLAVDRIGELSMLGGEPGVSKVLGLVMFVLFEVFAGPHELVGAVGGLDGGYLGKLQVLLGIVTGLSDHTVESRGNQRLTGVICHCRLIVALIDLVIIIIGAHERGEVHFRHDFANLTGFDVSGESR